MPQQVDTITIAQFRNYLKVLRFRAAFFENRPTSYDESPVVISLADLRCFIFGPCLKTHSLNTTKIIELEIMWISLGSVCAWLQKRTGKFPTFMAKIE
jgi:hypothetical protein